MKISVCENIENFLKAYPKYDLNYEWEFEKKDKIQLDTIQNKNCSIIWKAPVQVYSFIIE